MTRHQYSENQVVARQRHKHAELLRAVADGEQIQIWYEAFGTPDDGWEDVTPREVLNTIERGHAFHWRIEPQPEPDIINKMFVEAYPKLDNAWNTPNLELTFDGETQKLKAVRILDAT